MPHQSNELLRKALHIGIGLGAFALKWIPWPVAAGVCVIAVFANWLLLHRIVGKSVSRHERGYDAGIVLYPLMVLALILTFRHQLVLAAVVWSLLAFGDGFATLVGRAVGGPRLPWNQEKSWSGFLAFIAFGALGALGVWTFLGAEPRFFPVSLVLGGTVLATAIVESLPLGINDNLTVPIVGAFTIWTLYNTLPWFVLIHTDHPALIWLAVNLVLSIVAYLARSVDVSGMIGGFILGAIIILLGGWPLYASLVMFFFLGTVTTKLGYRRKAAAGLAQEKGGRRGFSHAFANAGVAAILSLAMALMHQWDLLYLAAVASLATAAADTCASEIGQLLGRRTFLPLTFRRVERGTEGAVSIEGTLAGLVAGAIVSATGVLLARGVGYRHASHGSWFHGASFTVDLIVLVTACAFLGSYLESIVGSWNRKQEKPIPNGVLNFFNTAVGAVLVPILGRSLF